MKHLSTALLFSATLAATAHADYQSSHNQADAGFYAQLRHAQLH